MLRAIIAGEENPDKLAALGNEQLKASQETLAEALHGHVTPHHRFLLKQHLDMVEHLEKTVSEFEAQIEAARQPLLWVIERLATIPGVSTTAASVIAAEIGVDMQRFPTVAHLISWAGLCPGLNESAGKIKSWTLRNGAPWLKTVLVQSAWAASHNKDGYLRAQFLRIKSRTDQRRRLWRWRLQY